MTYGPAPPLVDPQTPQLGDRALLFMALRVLQNMATENTGWRSFFRRWYFSDEPLRNDAANIVRAAQFQGRRPEGTRIIGEVEPKP